MPRGFEGLYWPKSVMVTKNPSECANRCPFPDGRRPRSRVIGYKGLRPEGAKRTALFRFGFNKLDETVQGNFCLLDQVDTFIKQGTVNI